jgi:hypothetical protein
MPEPEASQHPAPLATLFAEVLGQCARIAQAQERTDLVTRVRAASERLDRPDVRVVVAGEFKKGKSALINSLLGTAVCPVDDHAATSVPTVVRYGDRPAAVAVSTDPADPARESRRDLEIAKLADHVTDLSATPGSCQRIEVLLPDPLLQRGLVLVDTPGVGGLETSATLRTLAMMPGASGVIFVSDCGHEYTAPEVEFMEAVRQLCPTVICALTKADIFPHHSDVLAINNGHLAARKLGFPVVAVSCALRDRAWQTKDVAINELSGFPALKTLVIGQVLNRAAELAVRATVSDAKFVLDQCAAAFKATAVAATDPAAAAQLMADLKAAQENATMLRGNSARWQLALNDGAADLNAQVDYDLRSRFRSIGQEADDAIEQSDPAKMWPEFCAWLERRVAHDVSQNFLLLSQRVSDLASRVAELFAGDEAEITHQAEVALPDIKAGTISLPDPPKAGDFLHTGLSLFKGTYSNMEMFSGLGNLLKWHILGGFNPLSVGLGLLVGGRAIHDERRRELESHRQQAKAAQRKYTDDVQFRISNDSREALRSVQRQLRDSFTARADQLARTTTAAVAQAQAALNEDMATRKKRATAAEQELTAISAVVAKLGTAAQQALQMISAGRGQAQKAAHPAPSAAAPAPAAPAPAAPAPATPAPPAAAAVPPAAAAAPAAPAARTAP